MSQLLWHLLGQLAGPDGASWSDRPAIRSLLEGYDKYRATTGGPPRLPYPTRCTSAEAAAAGQSAGPLERRARTISAAHHFCSAMATAAAADRDLSS